MNTFCTGNEQMANGEIMVVGGTLPSTEHTGIPAANIFNPATESWTVAPDMSYPRTKRSSNRFRLSYSIWKRDPCY